MKVSNMNIPFSAEKLRKVTLSYGNYKTSENFACRDPFIMRYEDKYYLYKQLTTDKGGEEIVCHVSTDLENWSDPITVYAPPKDFHGINYLFWAPECHYYKGNFYIFTSVFSKNTNHRNISVYRANNPLGPFEDIADGCVGKPEWDTIDGTLYVDEDGQPWMVFVHEWTSMPDKIGGMAVAKLSEDLSHFISEPKQIFKATDTFFARSGVTDGPYLYETERGRLIMIWSNFGEKSYFIAKAYSDNGIDGDWKHEEELLYEQGLRPEFKFDGGHGMIFEDKEGNILLSLHTPNTKFDGYYEHLSLFELVEEDNTVRIK